MNNRRKIASLSRPHFTLLLLILCLLAYPMISQGVDMFGWFKKQDVFLCSEVNGVVTENGKPVANIEITRSLIYTDEKIHRDIAITDNTGHFYFPQKSIRSSIPSKPFAVNRVSQEIFIDRKGTLVPFWVATHVGIKEMPEFTKKLAFLNCELTNQRVSFQFQNNHNEHLDHMASSICRWDEDYIPIWLFEGNEKKYEIHDGDFNKLTERFTNKEVKL
ncbi:hypothetical protein L3081_21240 [Colwellia sp. MSW7]|uniref:DUF6795 domain-containing protein n=1 Tax=Colwellia maritima TaxID=2912588 RepID=A0ABS9X5D5_9GAMM|nr:DUF6795 domain-containing protein [Colwellia maritima]MCI2285453.1 hypothetical protein [Colwellia maritima]